MNENEQRYFMSVLWSAYTVHLRRIKRDEGTEMDLAKRAENRAARAYLERFVSKGPGGPELRSIVIEAMEQVRGERPSAPDSFEGGDLN